MNAFAEDFARVVVSIMALRMELNIFRAVELGGQVRRQASHTFPSPRQSGRNEARGWRVSLEEYAGSEISGNSLVSKIALCAKNKLTGNMGMIHVGISLLPRDNYSPLGFCIDRKVHVR